MPMPDNALQLFFRKLERRDTVSPAEKQALADAAGSEAEFGAGSDLVREGDWPERSILILSGFATRYRVLKAGERQITAIHVPGDFVDLHSFVLKQMDHSVGALSDCRIRYFPHEGLREITERFPHLTRVLWLMTLLDSSIHREWIVAMGRRSAGAQLAHLICELYVRLGIIGLVENQTFNLPITQAELSDALGISAVHVNRVLQELRAENLFTWHNQTIHILDWPGLQQRAEFDERYLHLQNVPR